MTTPSTTAERFKTTHRTLVCALHADLRRFPGGYLELAAILGRQSSALSAAFNPNDFTVCPTADMLVSVLEVARPFGALSVLAHSAGYALRPLPPDGDGCLTGALRSVVKEVGDVLAVVGDALGKEAVGASARDVLCKEIDEAIAALVEARKRVSHG